MEGGIGTVIIAAATSGLALGSCVTALAYPDRPGSWPLAGVFASIGLLCTPALIAVLARGVYPLWLSALLPVLLALPWIFSRFVEARVPASIDLKPPSGSQGRRAWPRVIYPALGLVTAVAVWMLPGEHRHAMLVEGALPADGFSQTVALVVFVLVLAWPVVSALHGWAILRRLARYRRDLRDRYSNLDSLEMRWVEGFMAFVAILWLAVAAATLTDNLATASIVSGPALLGLTAGGLTFLLAFAVRRPRAVQDEPGPLSEPTPTKYARSALTGDHARRLAERIDRAMTEDRLYLDANLSLAKLSRHVAASANLVSQTLNEAMGKTFFDYVNDRRVEAAKNMLRRSDQSVLDVGLAVGFNSRSTFYKAFKSATGSTPQAFRRAAAENESD